MSHSVRVFSDLDALAQAIAAILIKVFDRIEPDHFYTIALSGGSTPEYIFRYLGENYAETVGWEKLLVFWGDERCVAPEAVTATTGWLTKAFCKNLPIPDANIFQ